MTATPTTLAPEPTPCAIVRDAAKQAWSGAAEPPKDPGPGPTPRLGDSARDGRAD